jgi:hypothetical protein
MRAQGLHAEEKGEGKETGGSNVSEGNAPSKDFADDGTLAGAFRQIFRKLQQSMDGMLPAIVVNYDRASNTATVRPVVTLLTTDGSTLQRAQVAKVPVLALGNRAFAINFPLQPGDFGWIEASDRDISLFLQSLNEAQPNTLRFHSFEDARFVPDAIRGFVTDSVAADAMTIQTADGEHRVTISPTEGIRLKSSSPVEVEGSTLKFTGPATFVDPVTFQAHTDHQAGAKISGVEHATHKHGGVTAGGAQTGVPV